jgi:hypothetical protein
MRNLELSAAEAAALVRLLREAIDADHFPLSPRVQVWLGILGKLRLKPEPARPAASPEPRVYALRREGGIAYAAE